MVRSISAPRGALFESFVGSILLAGLIVSPVTGEDRGTSDVRSRAFRSGAVASKAIGRADAQLGHIQPVAAIRPAKTIKTASGLEITVSDSDEGARVLFGPEVQDGQAKVSLLREPSRLVVDLLGRSTSGSHAYDVGAGVVSRIRTGDQSGAERVVLDLVPGKYTSRTEFVGDNLLVALSAPTSDRPAGEREVIGGINKSGELELSSNSTKKQPANLMPVAAGGRSASETTSDSDIAKALKEEISAAQESQATVSAVRIASASEGSNSVIAELTAPAKYTLKRTAPSEYVVKIANAKLDTKATVTLIAPPAAGAVRSVRPVAQAGDVLLRVFVKPESSLLASTRGNELILAEAAADAIDPSDMMAQLAPEGAKVVSQASKPAVGAGKAEEAKSVVAAGGKSAEPAKAGSVSADGATAKGPAVEPVRAVDPDMDRVASLLEEENKYTGRLISLDLQDTDIDNALRIIAEVSNLNIIASEDVTGKITLRLIDVPWDQALDVILKTNGLDKVQEGNVVRIAPVQKLRDEREALKQARLAEQELEPLAVEYIRISYARAAELKALVETVLSERGTVASDERTNQLIVKDIRSGIRNVAKLVAKLDLRTPQILLETQIVEATRSLQRDLGAQLGFNMVWSPATGNALGTNFPNAATIGGALPGTSISGNASSYPASAGVEDGNASAIGIVLQSADGTKSLGAVLSAYENEGRVRIVSRPSVATTNNKPAQIKSVEKIRVRLPDSGLSVATGQGASASSSSTTATESIEIGITLDVTPQASPDYYVLLDLKAKSSTPGTRQVDGIPSEIERAATSTVLISSGQTFAMGGIYRIRDEDSLVGVPFLKDVPVLGTFFRRQFTSGADEELIFFLTPRIVEGSFDDAAMRAVS